MKVTGLVWLVLLLPVWPAVTRPDEDATPSAAEQRITVLEQALASRDKQIQLLEADIESWKSKLDILHQEKQNAVGEAKNFEQRLSLEQSITSFQEQQIEQFREVVREQRKQINELNQLLNEAN